MTQLLQHAGTAIAPAREREDARLDNIAAPQRQGQITGHLRRFWERRRFLFSITLAGAVAGFAIAMFLPPRYESEAELMPPDTTGTAGIALAAAFASQPGGMGSIAGDLLGMKSTGALFVGMLNSRTVRDRIVAQYDLKRAYRTHLDEAARRELSEHSSITEDRKSGIVSIRVSDREPERAAAIANAYARELDRMVAQLATSSARREREFLAQRLDTVRGELEAAENDFGKFATRNAAIDITEQGKAELEAGAAVQGGLIAAESELEGLKQIYTPNNVRVRSLEARVGELRKQLEKLGGRADEPPADGHSYPSLRQLPMLGVAYADLYRRTKVEEAIFETLTKEYELARVEEAKEIPTVRVLDTASVPQTRAFPPRLWITTLGVLFGFGLGAAWIFVKDRWDATPDDQPEKSLALEIYSTSTGWIVSIARRARQMGRHDGGERGVAGECGVEGECDVAGKFKATGLACDEEK